MGTLIARAFELALMAIYFSLSSDAPHRYTIWWPSVHHCAVCETKQDLSRSTVAHRDLVITKQRRKSKVDGKEE